MINVLGRLTVCATAMVVWFITPLRADDAKKVPPYRVPKVIMDAIMGRFPGGQIKSVERETEHGKVVYDVELRQHGRKYEMDIHEDGRIAEIEKEVPSADVPEAVMAALKARYRHAKIVEVMEVSKVRGKDETPVHYEATIQMPGKKPQEVIVSLDGKRFGKE